MWADLAAVEPGEVTGPRPWREGAHLMSPDASEDAFAVLGPARDEEPVFHMPKHDMWCITRYADAREVMRDAERFATTPYGEGTSTIPRDVADQLGVAPDVINPVFNPDNVLALDPPRHTRMRRTYQYAFTPKATVRYEELVRACADELIDGFAADGRVEFMEHFAVPLPIIVLARVIGLPSDRVAEFSAFFDAAFEAHSAGLTDGRDATEAWRQVVAFSDYFHDLIDDRRSHPQDDLISEAIHAVDDDGRPLLNDQEIFSSLAGLATAGGETTASLLAHLLLMLRRCPGQWEAVLADRSLLAAAVEETMRFRGPVAGLLRRARVDAEVAGTTIPAGALVYVALQSVNRDEQSFEEAGTYDVHRDDAAKHLGFGIGMHKCVGAALARLEGRIALDRLMDRLPGLLIPDQELALKPQLLVPRLESLVVEWDT